MLPTLGVVYWTTLYCSISTTFYFTEQRLVAEGTVQYFPDEIISFPV